MNQWPFYLVSACWGFTLVLLLAAAVRVDHLGMTVKHEQRQAEACEKYIRSIPLHWVNGADGGYELKRTDEYEFTP